MNSIVCEGEYPVIEIPDDIKSKPLKGSGEAFEVLKQFGYGETETAVMIAIDDEDHIISAKIVSIGGRDSATMSICDMMRSAVADKAAGIIIAHTHPGEDLSPSGNDEQFVQDLRDSCTVLGIALVDSLILSNGKYQSMFAKRVETAKTTRMYIRMICTALADMGCLMQEAGGVILAIFLVACYIAVTNGQPLPPLDSTVTIILFLYPVSWAVRTLGKFAETLIPE